MLRKLAEGVAEADLLDAYPNLCVGDIRAARDVWPVRLFFDVQAR
ncbi:MAG: hypothetical protein DCC72_00770 [Burkholderiales bacterium]|nr:MAG: hypothetical protein DCC72_00770 [Burkholderiales bacterium]